MKTILLTLALAFTALTTALAQEEQKAQIRLTDGTRIQGIFVEEKDNGNIILQQRDGVEYEYNSEDISGFRFLKDKPRSYRKMGYVAVSAGVNIPLGDFGRRRGGDAEPGANFNVDFGILFNKYIGITAKGFVSANALKDGYYDDDFWGYSGMGIGPLFSFPAAPWLDIDLRPMIAFAATTFPGADWDDWNISPAFIGSAMFRFHVSPRISLVFEPNYFYTSTRYSEASFRQHIGTLSFNGGIAIRFK
ncbi:hypothetical protein [Taibaiella koreensis]|uniref:hypothetical protein n=1 Tax=Taibaiella koreensis TaxID=1268548 RepID=UPI000E59D132|nr:hypothetical protein [Taibaiella koreensis]